MGKVYQDSSGKLIMVEGWFSSILFFKVKNN
jgi:hypothetical protein